MATRLELQSVLEDLLGSNHVYYQPPESVKMTYPAIVYSKPGYSTRKADDILYAKMSRYDLTVIDRVPDNPIIDQLLEFPYCSYDRQFKSDNLYHDTFTLYF